MLGDKAREFLKTLHRLDRIWDYKDVDWEYSELQLVQFAERYHEHKLNDQKAREMINNLDINKDLVDAVLCVLNKRNIK